MATARNIGDVFMQFEEQDYLRPIAIPDKEEYFSDIHELVGSLTFFVGKKYDIACQLVRETERMLINAISLFEKGYFDAAFYMLRQALEICMTIAYFLSLPDDEREVKFKDWKGSIAKFPGVGQMRQELENKEYSIEFKDFQRKMPVFFDEFKEAYRTLNKYTHKQGFRYFYSVRWCRGNDKDMDNHLLANFLHLLNKCIGCSFVFRLMIDPLPILIMDDEIEYRLADAFMFPISMRVLHKYIGDHRIEEYKQTDMYLTWREDILKNRERMSEATYEYVKNGYAPRQDIQKIFKQVHLLTPQQVVELLLVSSFPEIAIIHSYDGLWNCLTDVKCNRSDHSDSSEEFKKLRDSDKLVNQPFKGVFASVVKVQDQYYTLEHNIPFDPMSIIRLGRYAEELEDMIKAWQSGQSISTKRSDSSV